MKAGAKMNRFTKIISVILAVVLVIMAIPFTTFAAQKGDVDGDGKVSAVDARLILQVVAGLKTKEELQNADAADLNGDGITAVDARMVLQIVAGLQDAPTTPSEPEKPIDSQKAEMAALFNAETAKIAQGTYKWARSCEYAKDLKILQGNVSVNTIKSTVDKFLGVGNQSGNQSDAGKYALIPMNLKESDIKEVQANSNRITLILNTSSNPAVGDGSPFSNVSKDIVEKKDVENEIKSLATLNDFYAHYYNVIVSVRLAGGGPESITISYDLYARLSAKAKVFGDVTGEGTVSVETVYTNLKY